MKRILFPLLFTFSIAISAQIKFDAEVDRDRITTNETIVLKYSIYSEDPSVINDPDLQIKFPDLENNFRVISTMDGSSNESDSRGRMVSNYTITIVLAPLHPGNLNIDPAELHTRKGTVRSERFTIKVNDGGNANIAGNRVNKKMGGFLAFEFSKNNPYLNEGILGELVFYSYNPMYLKGVENPDLPKFENFSVQYVDFDPSVVVQKRINGDLFYGRIITKVLLTPTKAGQNTINPAQVSVIVNNGFYNMQEQRIKSGKVNIYVKNLPNNKPADFNGAVGSFTLSSSNIPNEVSVNETIDLNVYLKGNGNLSIIKAPTVHTPSCIESYSTVLKPNIEIDEQGMKGTIGSKNILVPQKPGNYTIKVSSFSYFDINKNSYVSFPEKSYSINVEDNGVLTSVLPNSSENSSHEKDEYTLNQKDPKPFPKGMNSYTYYVGTASVVLVALLGFLFYRKRKNSEKPNQQVPPQENVEKVKTKNSVPAKPEYSIMNLENAYFQNDYNKFYQEIEGLLNSVSKENLSSNVGLKNEYAALKQKLSTVKYSPLTTPEDRANLLYDAQKFYKDYFKIPV